MNFGSIIIITFMTYYTVYLLRLFRKKNREQIRRVNLKLAECRQKPIKSLEEQKDFLDIKFPKREKFTFTWNWFFALCLNMLFYIIVFYIYFYIFTAFEISIPFWLMLVIVFLFPFIMNYILNRYHLEKESLHHLFKMK